MDRILDTLTSLEIQPIAVVDIAITAVLIYWLFSLIRGTRAVRLVIGVISLYAVYVAAQAFGFQLLSPILPTGAVVGPLAAALLPAERSGALIVLERETGLEDAAETGVMLHADLSAELLRTVFAPRAALHDGAVLIRGAEIVAAGIVLPLAETTLQSERLGTRHRAALGITEQTDAVVVVVSEESGSIALVERARIIRNLDEERLRTALVSLLQPGGTRGRGVFTLPAPGERGARALRLVRRRGPGRHQPTATAPAPAPRPGAVAGAKRV